MELGRSAPPRALHRRAFGAAATVVVALDQLTKEWALTALADEPIDLVGSLRLNLTFNDGSAFGLGAGRTTLVAVIALMVSLVVARMGWRSHSRGWALGLGLVMGGAVGNLVDRAVRAGDGFLGGGVVDFIDLQWWPIFNLADVAICIGAGALVVLAWRDDERARG